MSADVALGGVGDAEGPAEISEQIRKLPEQGKTSLGSLDSEDGDSESSVAFRVRRAYRKTHRLWR